MIRILEHIFVWRNGDVKYFCHMLFVSKNYQSKYRKYPKKQQRNVPTHRYGEVSQRRNIPRRSVPNGEMSQRRSVPTAKCPNGEVSQRRNVLTAKCPNGEMSQRRNVPTAKCPTANCPTAKCPTAMCPTAMCPFTCRDRGKKTSAYLENKAFLTCGV